MALPAGETVLSLRGLEKSFPVGFLRRQAAVLRGIDLAVEAREVLGLLGPNGSGKSTLLRIAAGVERPDAGEVRLFGSTPEDPAARARIGYLPESSPFPEELSVRAVLDLLATLHGMKVHAGRARAAELLGRVGLAGVERRTLGRLSQGMLRRFGFAQVLLHRPELILLDEPTAGLDAPGYLVLEDLLGELRARGGTVVIASHNVTDLLDYCDRVIVLVDGAIVASGDPTEILGGPGSARQHLIDLYRAGSGTPATPERAG